MKHEVREQKQSAIPAEDRAGSGEGLLLAASAGQITLATRLRQRIRNYLITGLVTVAPITLTLYVIWWIVGLIDSWIRPFLPQTAYLPFDVPGVGLVIALLGVTLVGALAANMLGRMIVNYGAYALARIPIIRSFHRTFHQIFNLVFGANATAFRQMGVIEFPRLGLHYPVFIAGSAPAIVQEKVGEPLVTVFAPTSPNPITGFLLFIPEKDLTVLSTRAEDGLKLVLSAGLVAE